MNTISAPISLTTHTGAKVIKNNSDDPVDKLVIKYLEHLDLHGAQLADQDSKKIYQDLFQLSGGLANPGRGLESAARATLEKAFVSVRHHLLPSVQNNEEPLIPAEHLPKDNTTVPADDDGILLPIEHQPKPKKDKD